MLKLDDLCVLILQNRRRHEPSPLSSDPLQYFNAPQQACPPQPHLAVGAELIAREQRLELDNAERPAAVLDEHAQPG